MAERRPIYSAQAAGQQIGYIEDDEAFDLFDSACAVYESNTGLLRDPKNNAVVGYVSLADIFVGSSWMAQELFSKTGPIAPRASLEELEDGHSDAPVCGAEDCDAENVDGVRIIAQVQSHHAAKTGLFVASTPVHSETASVEKHAPNATDITTFASSSQQDKVVGTVLPSPTDLGDSSTEQSARPQDASDASKRFSLWEPGSDYPSRAMGEGAPALQPEADTSVIMPEESAFESAQPDEPSGGDRMPPAVEAFMRHLSEYLHSSNHQIATLSSDDAAKVKLSPSVEAPKDTDRAPVPGEPEPQGELRGSAPHSEPAGVDHEHRKDCFAVRDDSPVEVAQDTHQEGNSGAAEGVETNDASRDIFSTDMDRILLGVLRDVQKNSSSA